jgi:hypothetical protein
MRTKSDEGEGDKAKPKVGNMVKPTSDNQGASEAEDRETWETYERGQNQELFVILQKEEGSCRVKTTVPELMVHPGGNSV